MKDGLSKFINEYQDNVEKIIKLFSQTDELAMPASQDWESSSKLANDIELKISNKDTISKCVEGFVELRRKSMVLEQLSDFKYVEADHQEGLKDIEKTQARLRTEIEPLLDSFKNSKQSLRKLLKESTSLGSLEVNLESDKRSENDGKPFGWFSFFFPRTENNHVENTNSEEDRYKLQSYLKEYQENKEPKDVFSPLVGSFEKLNKNISLLAKNRKTIQEFYWPEVQKCGSKFIARAYRRYLIVDGLTPSFILISLIFVFYSSAAFFLELKTGVSIFALSSAQNLVSWAELVVQYPMILILSGIVVLVFQVFIVNRVSIYWLRKKLGKLTDDALEKIYYAYKRNSDIVAFHYETNDKFVAIHVLILFIVTIVAGYLSGCIIGNNSISAQNNSSAILFGGAAIVSVEGQGNFVIPSSQFYESIKLSSNPVDDKHVEPIFISPSVNIVVDDGKVKEKSYLFLIEPFDGCDNVSLHRSQVHAIKQFGRALEACTVEPSYPVRLLVVGYTNSLEVNRQEWYSCRADNSDEANLTIEKTRAEFVAKLLKGECGENCLIRSENSSIGNAPKSSGRYNDQIGENFSHVRGILNRRVEVVIENPADCALVPHSVTNLRGA